MYVSVETIEENTASFLYRTVSFAHNKFDVFGTLAFFESGCPNLRLYIKRLAFLNVGISYRCIILPVTDSSLRIILCLPHLTVAPAVHHPSNPNTRTLYVRSDSPRSCPRAFMYRQVRSVYVCMFMQLPIFVLVQSARLLDMRQPF